MSALLKIHLKVFAVFTLSFSLVYLLIMGWNNQSPIAFSLTVITFGVLMTLLLVGRLKKKLQEAGIEEFTDDVLRPKQYSEVESNLTKEELIHKLRNDPIIGKMKITETNKEIHIRSGISWDSFGERVRVRLEGSDPGRKKVYISSKPLYPLTLIDYGQNKRNVVRIAQITESG